VSAGDVAFIDPAALTMPLGTMLVGRAFDARGVALDGKPKLRGRSCSVSLSAPGPSQRTSIESACWTGIRAIDGLLTIGRGARAGIFGPPGVGKSMLLHALMCGTYADAVVVGLVGERGREAEEWIRRAPRHASIVCATSDRSAPERVRAAHVAMAQANALRSRGLHVLLILDSLARYASALREIAIGAGEAAGRGGYPGSVFSNLARYVEIAGTAQRGSITCIATVLSDGDECDPVSDAARSLLDGHIQLSRALAHAGRYPAIDLTCSTSRTMELVIGAEHADDARIVRRALSVLQQTEEARALGIMPAGAFTLRALAAEEAIEAFMRQGPEPEMPARTLSALHAIADKLR
jgi:type III secretion protein N (ATPase)